jgi:hypothetical protein
MATQWEIGSHEVQVIITVTLLVTTSILALLCDYLRFRALRRAAPVGPETTPLKTAIAPTLVPEIEVADSPAPKSARASRLATALKQPRRVVSPEVQAIIERSSQSDNDAPKKATLSHKKSKLRRAV